MENSIAVVGVKKALLLGKKFFFNIVYLLYYFKCTSVYLSTLFIHGKNDFLGYY